MDDAPFIGSLICATNCKFNCKNCINFKVKNLPTQEKDAISIIKEVIANPFNYGIILSGLEWSLQIEEAIELAKEAKRMKLQVMLYTGLNWEEIFDLIENDLQYFDYIKCGKYEEDKKVLNNYQCGVLLATSNQKIFEIEKKEKNYKITFTQNIGLN